MRSTTCSSGKFLAFLVLTIGAAFPAAATPPSSVPSFFGDAYPMQVEPRFHPALMHWMDSIADLKGFGLTGGETTPAHRAEYEALFGPLTGEAADHLRAYLNTRNRFIEAQRDWLPDRLTRVFLEARDFNEARLQSSRMLAIDQRKDFIQALDYFEPKYRRIWNDGALAQAFLDGSRERDRRRIGRLLRRVADFFGADPSAEPVSQLHLVPVPDGYGTHAQTLYQHLIVEIRPGDTLKDQLAPIVHESAHYLFFRADRDAMQNAQAQLNRRGPQAVAAWRLLREALPTAIAQGFAEQQLNASNWSIRNRWYHRDDIDRYAKILFPMVRKALLDKQRTFDEAFVIEALELYPGPIRRSP